MQKNHRYYPDKERAIQERQRILFGERYTSVSLSSLRSPEWVQVKIQEFMKSKKNMMVYCGNPGLGKTFLCAAMTDWAMTEFPSFRYWKEGDLFRELRNSMDNLKGDYSTVLKYLIDDDLVFLDDVGSTKLNEWHEEIFFDFLDQRYNSMKPTVITSNFSIAQFKQFYKPRVASRLFDKDNTVIEILDGPDHRQE